MTRWSQYVHELMQTADMGKTRTIHGLVFTLGMCGEADEVYHEFRGTFDRPRMLKELGDFAWYTGAMWNWCGFDDEPLGLSIDMLAAQAEHRPLAVDTAHLPTALLSRAGKFAEAVKKHLGHDKPFDRDLFRMLLTDAIVTWFVVVNGVGLDASEVLATNIDKLRARYKGGGFSVALANAPHE